MAHLLDDTNSRLLYEENLFPLFNPLTRISQFFGIAILCTQIA